MQKACAAAGYGGRVKEIASLVGYELGVPSFSQRLKRCTGKAPAEFSTA